MNDRGVSSILTSVNSPQHTALHTLVDPGKTALFVSSDVVAAAFDCMPGFKDLIVP